jgi:ATP-dependent Clp protease ATP-binding subunit ClpA
MKAERAGTVQDVQDVKYSPGFQRMLEYAAYDCSQTGGGEVGVDHLLMGLYREDFPLIDEVLGSFRVDSMVVLERLWKAYERAAERTVAPEKVRLGAEALAAIHRAEVEARRMGHEVIEPSHTLVGILELHRDRLDRYFVRENVYRAKEDAVIEQVRKLVRWLRFEQADRSIESLDGEAVASFEASELEAPSPGELRRFAVRLSLLKAFRGR